MRWAILLFLVYTCRTRGTPVTPLEFYRHHPAVLSRGTIGIVVPYGSPTLEQDVNKFSNVYNLPPPHITVIDSRKNDKRSSPLHWIRETSLDVQWAHVMAPLASLTIYVSPSALPRDLIKTIQTIRGVDVVSMSWGTPYYVADDVFRSSFGVIFVAASGDSPHECNWPATSTHVVAVGGTVYNSEGKKEEPWLQSGGGKCNHRNVPDVGMMAGNAVSIVVNGTWSSILGTSLAAPLGAGKLLKYKDDILGQKNVSAREWLYRHRDSVLRSVSNNEYNFFCGWGTFS